MVKALCGSGINHSHSMCLTLLLSTGSCSRVRAKGTVKGIYVRPSIQQHPQRNLEDGNNPHRFLITPGCIYCKQFTQCVQQRILLPRDTRSVGYQDYILFLRKEYHYSYCVCMSNVSDFYHYVQRKCVFLLNSLYFKTM